MEGLITPDSAKIGDVSPSGMALLVVLTKGQMQRMKYGRCDSDLNACGSRLSNPFLPTHHTSPQARAACTGRVGDDS